MSFFLNSIITIKLNFVFAEAKILVENSQNNPALTFGVYKVNVMS
jgi:hypothetical protein